MVTQIVVWLNAIANWCAQIVLAPIGVLPGWLSATVVAAITGVLMLWAFKYTSNQSAIRQTRNQIKANLLALSLFQDSAAVSLRCQGRTLLLAGRLLLLAVVPILVMLVPMCLLLGQLALWYQARPLRVGETAVVTLQLARSAGDELPEVVLTPTAAIATVTGPVRVPPERYVCWDVQARQPGYHRLTFDLAGQSFVKELAIGEGLMRTSPLRPSWDWSAALLHPREAPFRPDAPVQSIAIDYPARESWTAGTSSWIWYWFAVSLAVAFAVRPLLGVEI